MIIQIKIITLASSILAYFLPKTCAEQLFYKYDMTMDLQNVFYIMAIILMSLGVIFMLATVVLLFYIKKKVTDLHDYTKLKIDEVVEITERPIRTITNFGANLLGKATH
jgi:uncharacterized membrane protein